MKRSIFLYLFLMAILLSGCAKADEQLESTYIEPELHTEIEESTLPQESEPVFLHCINDEFF